MSDHTILVIWIIHLFGVVLLCSFATPTPAGVSLFLLVAFIFSPGTSAPYQGLPLCVRDIPLPTRGFILLTSDSPLLAWNFPSSRVFSFATRGFPFPHRAFPLCTRHFPFPIRGFPHPTKGFLLLPRDFLLLTRGFFLPEASSFLPGPSIFLPGTFSVLPGAPPSYLGLPLPTRGFPFLPTTLLPPRDFTLTRSLHRRWDHIPEELLQLLGLRSPGPIPGQAASWPCCPACDSGPRCTRDSRH